MNPARCHVSGELTTVADLDLSGGLLLLVFFHPECEFCAMEAPLWHQLGNNVWRNDIDIVGVAARTNEEALKGFLQEFQLHFPILEELGSLFTILGILPSVLPDFP